MEVKNIVDFGCCGVKAESTCTSSDSSANVQSEDSGFESAGSAGHCSTLAMLIVLAAMWAGN